MEEASSTSEVLQMDSVSGMRLMRTHMDVLEVRLVRLGILVVLLLEQGSCTEAFTDRLAFLRQMDFDNHSVLNHGTKGDEDLTETGHELIGFRDWPGISVFDWSRY